MITDTEARRIASDWHGGGGTALYAFASTGAIDTARADHNLYHEISDCIDELQQRAKDQVTTMRTYKRESVRLFRIQTYVRHHGKRGPVSGWADLS